MKGRKTGKDRVLSGKRLLAALSTVLILILGLLLGRIGSLRAESLIATIDFGPGHSLQALGSNPVLNETYVLDADSNCVWVIDGETDTLSGTGIIVGSIPRNIAASPDGSRLYVVNGGSDDVSVVDALTKTVLTTVNVGSFPYDVAVSSDGAYAYVGNLLDDSIFVIRTADNTVIQMIPLTPASQPYALAFNGTLSRFYSANVGTQDVSVFDATTNTLISNISLGDTFAYDIAFNPVTNRIYTANDDDTISVIDCQTNTVVGIIVLAAQSIAVNPTTNRIYASSYLGNSVAVIDGSTDTIIGSPIAFGSGPSDIAVNPITCKIYVVSTVGSTVSVLSGALTPTTTGISPDRKTAGDAGFSLTVNGANFVPSSTVNWNGSDRSTAYVSPTELTATIPASDIATAATASVTVTTPDSGTSNEQTFTVDAIPVHTFYFAEGYTGDGFQEYLCLANPNPADAIVDVTYLFGQGLSASDRVTVPADSRMTLDVNANPKVGSGREVAVELSSESAIVAERPMYFDYNGWTGGSDVVGATSTSSTWYFAEGYTGPGFDEYISVLNPGIADAHLTFRFQTQEAGEKVTSGWVAPASSRTTFRVNDLLGAGYQTSLKLDSDVPIVAERPVYFDYSGQTGDKSWTGGHCSVGAPVLAKNYFFAEGNTLPGFDEYLILQNPSGAAISVSATYYMGTGQGAAVSRSYDVEAGKRLTVYVPDEIGAGKDVSLALTSSSEFLAERPMYFDYSGETGGHCVIGAPATAPEWFFAEGCTSDAFTEFLCLQNPGATDAVVEIIYLTQEAGPLTPRTATVPANSRVTIPVNANCGGSYSLSARIRVTSGPGIICERPMYFNYLGWDGGHDVVGYCP